MTQQQVKSDLDTNQCLYQFLIDLTFCIRDYEAMFVPDRNTNVCILYHFILKMSKCTFSLTKLLLPLPFTFIGF